VEGDPAGEVLVPRVDPGVHDREARRGLAEGQVPGAGRLDVGAGGAGIAGGLGRARVVEEPPLEVEEVVVRDAPGVEADVADRDSDGRRGAVGRERGGLPPRADGDDRGVERRDRLDDPSGGGRVRGGAGGVAGAAPEAHEQLPGYVSVAGRQRLRVP
jgi:hypothetical protein